MHQRNAFYDALSVVVRIRIRSRRRIVPRTYFLLFGLLVAVHKYSYRTPFSGLGEHDDLQLWSNICSERPLSFEHSNIFTHINCFPFFLCLLDPYRFWFIGLGRILKRPKFGSFNFRAWFLCEGKKPGSYWIIPDSCLLFLSKQSFKYTISYMYIVACIIN